MTTPESPPPLPVSMDPVKQKSPFYKNWVFWFAVCFGLLIIGQNSEKDEPEKKRPQSRSDNQSEQTVSHNVSANQLYREYESNEVAADRKYKGKIVVVSGVIRDIGKDILDNAYVVIGGEGFLDGVQCTFEKPDETSLASLSKGQRVTIKGFVSGKMGNVQVGEAKLR